jgi:hypothetical protein
MCDHDHHPKPVEPRHGSALEHGEAHAQDHAQWSRRDFLTGMGLAAAGGAIVLSGTPVRAFGRTPLLAHLRNLGQEGAARQRFEEVLRRFPGSAASAMAEERLATG